jgi:hypothetical protein
MIWFSIYSHEVDIQVNSQWADVLLSFDPGSRVPQWDPVLRFITDWITTPIPLMETIAASLNGDFLEDCNPIFSSKAYGHFGIMKDSFPVFGGRRLKCGRCPLSSLQQIPQTTAVTHTIFVQCDSCGSQARFLDTDEQLVKENDEAVIMDLGNQIYRTPWPPLILDVYRSRVSGKRGRQDSDPPSQGTGSIPSVGETIKRVAKKRSKGGRFVKS